MHYRADCMVELVLSIGLTCTQGRREQRAGALGQVNGPGPRDVKNSIR